MVKLRAMMPTGLLIAGHSVFDTRQRDEGGQIIDAIDREEKSIVNGRRGGEIGELHPHNILVAKICHELNNWTDFLLRIDIFFPLPYWETTAQSNDNCGEGDLRGSMS